MKEVIIIGGGISGLTAAHELIRKGYKVTIYEAADKIGGLAKSDRTENENIPIEHSWRGYAPYYNNVRNIMKTIKFNKNLTVEDLLRKTNSIITPKDEERKNKKLKADKRIIDYLNLSNIILYTLTSGNKRTIKDVSNIDFRKNIENKLTDDGKDKYISAIGPGLGLSRNNTPLDHIGYFIHRNFFSFGTYTSERKDLSGVSYTQKSTDPWNVLGLPTSEGWFNPWTKHLEDEGVIINLNSKINNINYNTEINNIESIVIDEITINTKDKYIILAVDPTSASYIIKKSKLDNISYLKNIITIAEKGFYPEPSFHIGFSEKLNLDKTNSIISIIDSEFNITMYLVDNFFINGTDLGTNNKSLISGTITDSDTPGRLFGLPATKLNADQLQKEILYQIGRSKQFNRVIFEANGKNFSDLSINKFELWDKIDSNEDPDEEREPGDIFHIAVLGTQKLRPSNKTSIDNLILAGTYIDTSFKLFSMEGAVESGLRAAKLIEPSIRVYTHEKILPFKITGAIDDVLFDLGLPNIFPGLIFITIIGIIILVIYIIFRTIKILRKK